MNIKRKWVGREKRTWSKWSGDTKGRGHTAHERCPGGSADLDHLLGHWDQVPVKLLPWDPYEISAFSLSRMWTLIRSSSMLLLAWVGLCSSQSEWTKAAQKTWLWNHLGKASALIQSKHSLFLNYTHLLIFYWYQIIWDNISIIWQERLYYYFMKVH